MPSQQKVNMSGDQQLQDTLTREMQSKVYSPDAKLDGTQHTQVSNAEDLSVGLDKIVTQLDLVQKTLKLLENRISNVEDLAIKLEGRMVDK